MLELKEKPVISPVSRVQIYSYGEVHDTPVFNTETLGSGASINGPTILIEKNNYNRGLLQGEITARNHLLLTRRVPLPARQT
ncbi:MAG: hypothetical protein QM426_05430 [Euryarchaeota archaeon]|nr:hypothetical protein [Euryarchaeota archaeon]